MARKPAFHYERNHADYVALEKLPAPVRYALYESVSDYSALALLKHYNKYKKSLDHDYLVSSMVNSIRRTDARQVKDINARYDKPDVKPVYNYADHVVMAGIKGVY